MNNANNNPFVRPLAPAHHHMWNILANTASPGREFTEACIHALAVTYEPTLDESDVNTIIDMAIDANIIRATVIDGGSDFGFVPGLVAA